MTRFSISIEDQKVLNGKVFKLSNIPSATSSAEFLSLKIAQNAGAAVLQMDIRLSDGRIFNLLGTGNSKSIEAHYQAKKIAGDLFATNVFFQAGALAPLWPIANRLCGTLSNSNSIDTKVSEIAVRMPANNGSGADSNHLHGLLFNKAAEKISPSSNADCASLLAEFKFDTRDKYWTGQCEVKATHILRNNEYEYWLETKNVGTSAMPIASGAHPYFCAPSGDPESVKLKIPAKSLVEIDNYSSVLPTGKLLPIEAGSEFDFNAEDGVALHGRYLDNFWTDLIPNAQGFAEAEFIDEKAKLRIRITGLTKNITGIQAYAPDPKQNPSLGVFAALELVTNLPDPRAEIWKNMPTGMTILHPGETFRYGYKMELLELSN